jgi:hypothetical protein
LALASLVDARLTTGVRACRAPPASTDETRPRLSWRDT